jgi:ABC-type transporter Mla MlaB component
MADIRRRQDGDRVIVTVGGDLTVASAAALKTEMVAALQGASTVEVIVENITRIDISFPQLLCSAHRTAAARNKILTVVGLAREQLNTMLLRSGLSRKTGCQENTRTSCLWLNDQAPEA